jgi:hypothetical protein
VAINGFAGGHVSRPLKSSRLKAAKALCTDKAGAPAGCNGQLRIEASRQWHMQWKHMQ